MQPAVIPHLPQSINIEWSAVEEPVWYLKPFLGEDWGFNLPTNNPPSQMNDSTSKKLMKTALVPPNDGLATEISSPQLPMKICNDHIRRNNFLCFHIVLGEWGWFSHKV